MKRAFLLPLLMSPAGENGGDGGGGAPPPKADPPPATLKDDVATQLVKANAALAEMQKKEADRVAAAAAAQKAADEKALADKGEYQKLLEQKDKDLAALKPLADVGKAWADRVDERAKAANLDAESRAIFDSLGSTTLKEQFLNKFSTSPNTEKKPAANIGGGGAPPAGGAGEVETMLKAGVSRAQIKQQHPEKWDAYINARAAAKPAPAQGIAAMFRAN